jgi:hypothetical protein
MIWSEFVSCLDSLRTKIRSERNLKSNVDFKDEIVGSLADLLSGDDITREPPIPASEQEDDPLLSWSAATDRDA